MAANPNPSNQMPKWLLYAIAAIGPAIWVPVFFLILGLSLIPT